MAPAQTPPSPRPSARGRPVAGRTGTTRPSGGVYRAFGERGRGQRSRSSSARSSGRGDTRREARAEGDFPQESGSGAVSTRRSSPPGGASKSSDILRACRARRQRESLGEKGKLYRPQRPSRTTLSLWDRLLRVCAGLAHTLDAPSNSRPSVRAKYWHAQLPRLFHFLLRFREPLFT